MASLDRVRWPHSNECGHFRTNLAIFTFCLIKYISLTCLTLCIIFSENRHLWEAKKRGSFQFFSKYCYPWLITVQNSLKVATNGVSTLCFCSFVLSTLARGANLVRCGLEHAQACSQLRIQFTDAKWLDVWWNLLELTLRE